MYSVRTPFFGTGCTSESTTRTAMCSAATSCSRTCVSVIVVSALRISSLLPHLPETNSAMSFPCCPGRFGERPHPLVKEALVKETNVPIRQRAPLGAPCWIDLLTSDLDRAQDFYGTVLGWTFESAGPEYGGYVTASKDGRPVAGLMGNDPQFRTPDGWTTYLHTADIKAPLAAATAAGGAPCS